jgi:pSer/pThr/pTyr-binding forkhead associated (FHA) protein
MRAQSTAACTIGRTSKTNDADAPDVQLNGDKKVSRQHAVINYTAAGHRFRCGPQS